jgi:hypothetical protein
MIRHQKSGIVFRTLELQLCCLISLAWTNQAVGAEALAAYPGYTGTYDGFTLVLDERFDKLDSTIWKKGDGAVGGESMCRFTRQGVRIRDGILELVIDQRHIKSSYSTDHKQVKGQYEYYCGELRRQPRAISRRCSPIATKGPRASANGKKSTSNSKAAAPTNFRPT